MADRNELEDRLQDLFSDLGTPEPEAADREEVLQSQEIPPPQEIAATPSAALLEEEGAVLKETAEPQPDDGAQLRELERQVTLLQRSNYQLQRRAIHLEASTAVSQAAASILDPQELMQTTVELIRERFNFYHVSFFLIDETGQWAVVRASTGKVGRQMVAQPHKLAVGGESMVGWACAHRQPRIALDVGADAVHFDHPLLPHTRSEAVLPLQVGDRLLGALDVQSTEEAAFDDDDVRTLQSMADLVTIALENARLFAETRQRIDHQTLVTKITDRLQRATSIKDILTLTLEDLGRAFDLSHAAICLGTEAELLANGDEQDAKANGGQPTAGSRE